MTVEAKRMLLPSLKTLYDRQSEVDLALIAQDKEVILCHSVVAAANSAYIKQCLENYVSDDIPRTTTNSAICVKVNNVQKNLLLQIVEYFYTGQMEIIIADVTDLLLAATVLKIESLLEMSCCIVHKLLCMDNYETFLQFSRSHNIGKLQETCCRFVADNFPEILETNELSKLDAQSLISVLKDDGCRAESEDMILDAVVKWLQSNSEGVTVDIVERLIYCVRVQHCTLRKVYDVLESYQELFASVEMLNSKCLLHLCCETVNVQGVQVTCRKTQHPYSQVG